MPLDIVYRHLPQSISGVVPGTNTGRINPNEVAGILSLAVPFTLGLFLCDSRAGHRAQSAFMLLALLTGTAVLILTQSRAGFISVLAGIAVIGLALGERAPFLRLLAVLAFVVLATFVLAASCQEIGFGASYSCGDWLSARVGVWGRGLFMLSHNIMTGVGAGQFPDLQRPPYLPFTPPPESRVAHAHNFLLQAALDYGLLTAILLLGVITRVFVHCWEAWKVGSDPKVRWVGLALTAGMAGYCTFGLSDAVALGARGGLPFWWVVGMSASLPHLLRKSSGEGRRRPGASGIRLDRYLQGDLHSPTKSWP